MIKLLLKSVLILLLLIGGTAFILSNKMPAEEYAGLQRLIHHSAFGSEEHSETPFYIELERLMNLEIYSTSSSGCNLNELPAAIGLLKNLQELRLDCNGLTELPPEVGQLKNLRVLKLSKNHLSELPPEIWTLTNLEVLDLFSNDLSEIPPEIGQLESLRELDLYANSLSELPAEIGYLSNLQTLSVGSNRLPPEYPILIEDLLEYLRQRRES